MSELGGAYPSLVALARGYRDGSLKPSDVVRAHLDRIARLDGQLGAYQVVYAESAMAQAEAADRWYAAGYGAHPFLGIPFGLKDICDLEGHVTTGGSKARLDQVASGTAMIARRLLAAGGVLLGKTKTVETAFGGWGTNIPMGTPHNPWDMTTHRIPGGSSSGSGVSVASGMAACAVGTDTGGSVRLPAAFCGLTGLKVTEGVLPTDGILPLSQTLDTPGPMARSVMDAALMFETMAGRPGWDIEKDIVQASGLYAMPKMAGISIGTLSDEERDRCAPETLSHYDKALEILENLGARLQVFLAPHPYETVNAMCGQIIGAEAWANHGVIYARDDLPLDPDVKARMRASRDVAVSTYMADLAKCKVDRAVFLDRMIGFDAILTPTVTDTAPSVTEVDQNKHPGHFTRAVNYYGLCALSLPAGLTEAGLPTSLHIIARPHAEAAALGIGAAYEAARPAFSYPEIG